MECGGKCLNVHNYMPELMNENVNMNTLTMEWVSQCVTYGQGNSSGLLCMSELTENQLVTM